MELVCQNSGIGLIGLLIIIGLTMLFSFWFARRQIKTNPAKWEALAQEVNALDDKAKAAWLAAIERTRDAIDKHRKG